MIHSPDILILDEPTSGVDPVARDGFWQILSDLSRKDNVTIFVSTHFMNEAERCDRISLMHAGRVLISDTPAAIVASAIGRHAGGGLHRLSGRRDRPDATVASAAGAGRGDRRGRSRASRAAAPSVATLVRSAAHARLYAARGARAAPRSDPRHAGDARQRDADVRDRLRHQPGRRKPDLRGARPRRHHDQPRLRAADRRLALLHREARRSSTMPISTAACAAASSAWRSRSRPASAATCRAAARSRSAPGSTARCRRGRRRCAAMSRACTRAG